jgi:hypothetical protein
MHVRFRGIKVLTRVPRERRSICKRVLRFVERVRARGGKRVP